MIILNECFELNLDWLGVVSSCFWKKGVSIVVEWCLKTPYFNLKDTEENNHILNRILDLFAWSIWICCQFRLYSIAKTTWCFQCPFDSSIQSFVIHTLLFCWGNKLHTHKKILKHEPKKIASLYLNAWEIKLLKETDLYVPKLDICVVGSSFIPPWCDVISDLWPLSYTPSILPFFFLLFTPFLPSPRCLGPRQK